ncbi:hypothetical protein FKM82_011103 [Ascaphus truei]
MTRKIYSQDVYTAFKLVLTRNVSGNIPFLPFGSFSLTSIEFSILYLKEQTTCFVLACATDVTVLALSNTT